MPKGWNFPPSRVDWGKIIREFMKSKERHDVFLFTFAIHNILYDK